MNQEKKINENKYNINDFNNLIAERLNKIEKLKQKGIEPYPYSFNKTISNKNLKERFSGLEHGDESDEDVSVAGRIMTIRRMGKATFFTIDDFSDTLQIYLREDIVGKEDYKTFKLLDIGDFVGVNGTVFRTKTNEITVKAKKYILLSKSIRPLPEKFHGLQDKELKYRKRYLDLIMNKDSRVIFKTRSKIISLIRRFLEDKGFIEVETPILQVNYGGAKAKPFITHINAWDMDMFLSISPELYLKRLLVGGFEKVFTICKNFRNEGVDKSHNPEFTMIELYKAYADYKDIMQLFESLIEYIVKKIYGTTKINYVMHTDNGNKEVVLDFKAPWKRMTMAEAIKEFVGIDVLNMEEKDIIDFIHQHNIEYEHEVNWGSGVELIFEELCEDKLVQPVHITNHPRGSTPLCKTDRNNKKLLERFESYCCGIELSNAYSELNDPIVQRRLLTEQAESEVDFGDFRRKLDSDFLEAVETGMPPAGGLGFGIDRLVMFLTSAETIRDVILFPIMKPEKEEEN